MKLLIILMLVCSNVLYADEVDVQLLSSTRVTDDDSYHTGTWLGVQVNYKWDEVYVFGSKENVVVSPMGKAWEYDILGVGIGTKHRFSERINIFGQIGYYNVKNSWGGRKREKNEAIAYYLNNRYAVGTQSQHFHEFSVVNSEHNFGLTIGAELLYPLSKSWTAGSIISYRHMRIKEDISGYNDTWTCPGDGNSSNCDKWHYAINRDYSSLNMGFNLIYRF